MHGADQAGVRFSGWRILALATVTLGLTGPGQTIGVAVFIDRSAEADAAPVVGVDGVVATAATLPVGDAVVLTPAS